jgi:hypothetical protein
MKGKISGTRVIKSKRSYMKCWCETVWVKYTLFPKLNFKFLTRICSIKKPWYSLNIHVAPEPLWLFKKQLSEFNIRVDYESGEVNSTTPEPIYSILGLVKAEIIGYNLAAAMTNLAKKVDDEKIPAG